MLTFAADTATTPPSEARAAVAPRKGVRLEITRRGRIVRAVALLIVLAAIVTAALFGAGVTDALAARSGGPQTVSVTVQPGDTLWEYAQEYAPEGTDVRDWVIEVQRFNELPSAEVTAGSQISIPVGS